MGNLQYMNVQVLILLNIFYLKCAYMKGKENEKINWL